MSGSERRAGATFSLLCLLKLFHTYYIKRVRGEWTGPPSPNPSSPPRLLKRKERVQRGAHHKCLVQLLCCSDGNGCTPLGQMGFELLLPKGTSSFWWWQWGWEVGGRGLDSTYHTISSPLTPSRLSQRVFRVKLLTLWPFAATMLQPTRHDSTIHAVFSLQNSSPFTPLNFLWAVWVAANAAVIIQTIGICKYIKRMMLAAGRQVFIETN